MVCAHSLEGSHLAWGDPHEVEGGAHQVQSGGASRWSAPHIGVKARQRAGFSKKKCFSNALRHTLVVLGMH